jgi:hypothetical protein
MEISKIAKKFDAPAAAAGAAFLASAGHIVSVVSETNPLIFALAYPIGIDGLLYVGMKALKERRIWVGLFALLIGTFFSLAFNFHAENAVEVPRIVIAASMPICLLAAFVIEHIGRKTIEIPAPAAAPVLIPAAAPVALPSVRWVAAGARWTLPIVPLSAPAPAPIKVRASVRRPAAKPIEGRTDAPALTDGRTDGRTVRPAAWDVEKAVRLIADGRTNEDVAAAAGTNTKAIQRTKRAIKIMDADATLTDEQVSEMVNRDVSAAHVGRIRAALNTKENA